jgi:hypothetical protein
MFRYIGTNGITYALVKATVLLRGGKKADVFYFKAEDIPLKKGTSYANSLPKQFEIVEAKSGHPLVKKKIEP